MQYQLADWLLICALLTQLIFQVQLHLHHGDDVIGEHEHVTDYHFVTDMHPEDYASHENTHEFKTTPDFISKKGFNPDLNFVPVVFLLLLIPVFLLSSNSQWVVPKTWIYRYLFYGFIPPTRAPPLI